MYIIPINKLADKMSGLTDGEIAKTEHLYRNIKYTLLSFFYKIFSWSFIFYILIKIFKVKTIIDISNVPITRKRWPLFVFIIFSSPLFYFILLVADSFSHEIDYYSYTLEIPGGLLLWSVLLFMPVSLFFIICPLFFYSLIFIFRLKGKLWGVAGKFIVYISVIINILLSILSFSLEFSFIYIIIPIIQYLWLYFNYCVLAYVKEER